MPEPLKTLDLSPIGAIFHIMKTAKETNGKALEMEWELSPNSSGTPVHIHPSAVEFYKVLEGQFEVFVDGKWQMVSKGEEVSVPAGVPHTFRNPTSSVARIYNKHEPAMQFEEYFLGLGRAVERLSEGGKKPLKMNLKAAIYLSMIMKRYPKEIVSVNPPNFAVSILNFIGKLGGFKI